MESCVTLSMTKSFHRHHAQIFAMHSLLKTMTHKLEAIRPGPATGMEVQSPQIFDIDRSSSLFVYLREIGNLFPLLIGVVRGQKPAPYGAGKGRQTC